MINDIFENEIKLFATFFSVNIEEKSHSNELKLKIKCLKQFLGNLWKYISEINSNELIQKELNKKTSLLNKLQT